MEFVGRRVRKEFQGRGTFFGSVQAYLPATGFFKIMYDDGGFEELNWSGVSALLMPPPLPLSHPPESSSRRTDERWRRITNEGTFDGNPVVGCGVSGNRSGNFMELDLNRCEVIELDDDGGDRVRNLGDLHGFDLNEGLNLELHEGLDLNKEITEESSGVRKEMIDLNLDVGEMSENVGQKRKVRWFDLNVALKEDEVIVLDDDDDETPGENERLPTDGDNQKGKQRVTDDGEEGTQILNMENKEDKQSEKCPTGVNYGKTASVGVQTKRSKVIKEVSDNKIESDAVETIELDAKSGKLYLKSKSSVETPAKNFSDSVDCVDGASGSGPRGRRGTKRTGSSNSNITLATTEKGGPRAKRASFAGQDCAINAPGINNELPSPPTFSAPSAETITGPGCEKPEQLVILPPKVDLPPSSGRLDLSGVSVVDIFSVYAFLRCFSTFLFLSPFEMDDFVTCIKSDDATMLFDSIHVSLLKTLRIDLQLLSSEGSKSASTCLRSLNWNFLDLITWPVFVVQYLLLHSPGYIPGLDRREFEPLQRDYYEMPASAKVEILRYLCNDVVGGEAFRLEMNRRTLATEQPTRIASTSRVTAEDATEVADGNGDECFLCKMDGTLICCDGCPAAFHSRCVGVVSSQLPEGNWYCPECSIDKDRPWNKMSKSIRGAELLGTDPYGRQFRSSCDYLLVSESCNDEYSFWFYERNDLHTLIEALQSSPFIYDEIISAICKHWNVIHGFDRIRIDLASRSYSMQSASHEKRPLSVRHLTTSEALNKDEGFTGKRCDKKSIMTTYSNNIETVSGPANIVTDAEKDGVEMENQLVSSEGLAGVTQTFTKNSHYVNSYEFARTASSIFRELTSKSSDKIIEDATRSAEENVSSGQLNLIFNRFAEFSWSNIQNSDVRTTHEKCGWCIRCKLPEDEMDCLFVMNDRIPAVENFTTEILNMGSTKRKKHLIDVICHIICIENHLQGLLLGPWLDPNYSQIWRKRVLGAADPGSIKKLLLELESNLHHRAVSADWSKSVDSVANMGSACHIVRSSRRVSLNNESDRTRGKCSKLEITPTPKSACGLRLSWWRGGKDSRELFNWKALPRSLASKTARQGGFKKILGVQYPDSGETSKRTRYTAWRAAVETSRSVEKLALQVRELDANIRWDDIGNKQFPSKLDKESRKPIKSFEKVIIRKKCCEGEVVRYLLDFGKKRYIPDIVVKHGCALEDSSSGRRQYWLEESNVPLHLLKAFEEKIIARKSSKIISGELNESSTVVMKPIREKGFSYLFSRAERSQKHQCGHCEEDVNIREAVSCQYCKGFFHKIHAQESAGCSAPESGYTCHKCKDRKFVQVDAQKGKPELPDKGEMIRKEEHPVHLKKIRKAPVVVPAQHSVRNGVRISKLVVQNRKIKKRKRNEQNKPRDDLSEKLSPRIRWKKRKASSSSYWLNGLRLSRRVYDYRVMFLWSRKMLLSYQEEPTFIIDGPKCSLCQELEYTWRRSYVACDNCGVWFHGDALGLTANKTRRLIGFKCHNCLKKGPLVCPYQ